MTNPPNNMKILALDLATKTGWALLASGITSSGVVSFANGTKKAASKHAGGPFSRCDAWMFEQLLNGGLPDVIIYEEVYRWMSQHAANSYNGYRAMMISNASLLGVRCIGYSPPTIKKHFTGRGNANKSAMIAEARRKWPTLHIIDDNQIDALAILSLHCANHHLPDIDPQ